MFYTLVVGFAVIASAIMYMRSLFNNSIPRLSWLSYVLCCVAASLYIFHSLFCIPFFHIRMYVILFFFRFHMALARRTHRPRFTDFFSFLVRLLIILSRFTVLVWILRVVSHIQTERTTIQTFSQWDQKELCFDFDRRNFVYIFLSTGGQTRLFSLRRFFSIFCFVASVRFVALLFWNGILNKCIYICVSEKANWTNYFLWKNCVFCYSVLFASLWCVVDPVELCEQ